MYSKKPTTDKLISELIKPRVDQQLDQVQCPTLEARLEQLVVRPHGLINSLIKP